MNKPANCVTISAVCTQLSAPPQYAGGRVQFTSPMQRDTLALEIGRDILSEADVVHLESSQNESGWIVTADVDVSKSFSGNRRRLDMVEPAQAPAPSMPSASPPTREPNQERMDEIRQSLETIQALAATHADKEDWATAYAMANASIVLLERIIEELAV